MIEDIGKSVANWFVSNPDLGWFIVGLSWVVGGILLMLILITIIARLLGLGGDNDDNGFYRRK